MPQLLVLVLWFLNSVESLMLWEHTALCCLTPLQAQSQHQGTDHLNLHACLNQTVPTYSQAPFLAHVSWVSLLVGSFNFNYIADPLNVSLNIPITSAGNTKSKCSTVESRWMKIQIWPPVQLQFEIVPWFCPSCVLFFKISTFKA